MLYSIQYSWSCKGFELTTLQVIGTDCTGSCNSNYHTITTTTGPSKLDTLKIIQYVINAMPLFNLQRKKISLFMFLCTYIVWYANPSRNYTTETSTPNLIKIRSSHILIFIAWPLLSCWGQAKKQCKYRDLILIRLPEFPKSWPPKILFHKCGYAAKHTTTRTPLEISLWALKSYPYLGWYQPSIDTYMWIRDVMVVIIWLLDLQLPMQSVSMTTNIVSMNPAHDEVHSIQH